MICTLSHESRVMLSLLLSTSKDATRVWLRAEMDRLVDPMLDSIFNRLKTKLTNGLEQTQSRDDGHCEQVWNSFFADQSATLTNHNGQLGPPHVDQSAVHFPQPSTSSHLIPPHQNVHYSYQQPNDPIHCNHNIYKQSVMIPFVRPPVPPNAQVNFDQLSNEPTIADESNQNLNDEDAGECYCDECVNGIEIDDEVEVDDSDSVQCIEDEQGEHELPPPSKKPRIDSTQRNNTQPEVFGQAPRQPTHKEQPNEVIDNDKHYITVYLRCPELKCPETFAETELNDHLMNEHSIGPNRCLVKDCKQSFDNNLILGQHIKQSHQHTTQWHCDKCSKPFPTYRHLSIHNIQYHQLGQFQCSFHSCTFTGEYRKKVYQHYQQHNSYLVCPQSACQYRTKKPERLRAHERAHLGIKPYRCKWPDCDFSHASRDNAMVHIKTHFNPKSSSSDVALSGKPADYLEVVYSLM